MVSHDGLSEHVEFALLSEKLAARCAFDATTRTAFHVMRAQRSLAARVAAAAPATIVAAAPASSAVITYPSASGKSLNWDFIAKTPAEREMVVDTTGSAAGGRSFDPGSPTDEGSSVMRKFMNNVVAPAVMIAGSVVVAKEVFSSRSSDGSGSMNRAASFNADRRSEENRQQEEAMKQRQNAALDAQWQRLWNN